MKMLQTGAAGETHDGNSGGRTVVVGMKLDSPSRELLTWALVKVAQPGDVVVALHVLGYNEIVNRDGKLSLLSLVNAFDSVLAVYEGFCNLKQVDLKLKVCRGSSVKKILVREANAYSAAHIIVGTAHGLRTIRPSTSVAKFCARKLSKNCCVLAVNNGKVVFKRDGSPATPELKGTDRHCKTGLLGSIHRTFNKNSKVLNDGNTGNMHGKAFLESKETVAQKPSSSRSGPISASSNTSCHHSAEESSGDGGTNENALAIVPVQTTEAPPSSTTTLKHKVT